MKLRPAAGPYLYSILLLITALIISVGMGSVFISPNTLAHIFKERLLGNPINTEALKPFETIIFSLRLPRTILIAITGAALAGSGAAYQGLFQNPLADPYLIGVASGAGLGAIISMSVDWPYTLTGYMTVPVFAFIGALASVFIVYQLARVGSSVPITNLILAGVAVGSFATAITSFLMIKSTDEIRRAIVWLMGGATMSGWQPVLAVLPYTILGLGILLTRGHALNVLQYGDEQAQQMGLNVKKSSSRHYHYRILDHGSGGFFFRDYRFDRLDHSSYCSTFMGRRLSAVDAGRYYYRRRSPTDCRCSCQNIDGTPGNPNWNYHCPLWRTVLFMDHAPGKTT